MKDLPFTGNSPLGQLPIQEPIDYFRDIFSDELIASIVSESNIYACQIDVNKPLILTSEELEQFIGILFVMSIVKMTSTRDYWEKNMRYEKIADVMPVKRFEQIKRFLHFNNNMQMSKECSDKLFKIRPLIEALKERFQMIAPTENLCIDEQMVPFKGRPKLKQYNPQKPKKWGYKLHILTNPEGLIYNFEVHTGAIENRPGQPDLQASANIVMQLLQHIPRHQWSKLFIDNWYTGIPLATTLTSQGIALVGTVPSNRLRNCQLSSDRIMRQKGRGSAEVKTCVSDNVELRAIKWFDNRAVNILTTFEEVVPTVQIKRWDRKEKKELLVDCPSAVAKYNKNMGGVDLLDGLLSYYHIPVKSKKWYHRLIWHFLDVACVQAWLFYGKDACGSKFLSLKCFKNSIADSLLHQRKAKRGRPSTSSIDAVHSAKVSKDPTKSIPNKSIRSDGYEHWPELSETKGRCRYPGCKGIPKVKCTKCDVRLCLTPNSKCFRKFHE